jgi:hypothetical protein
MSDATQGKVAAATAPIAMRAPIRNGYDGAAPHAMTATAHVATAMASNFVRRVRSTNLPKKSVAKMPMPLDTVIKIPICALLM